MTFKDYFNAIDSEHVTHAGFLQSMDLSGYTDITMLNDLTMVLMDAYLFNELSSAVVMRNWRKYLTYDRTQHAFIIDPDFYAAFTAALYGYLARSERWYQLTQTDFTSLSATEIKTIEHGKQEKQLDFGAGQVSRAYGQDSLSKAYGATQKTNQHGAQSITRDYDRVVVGVTRGNDTHIVGASHVEGSNTTTGKVYPLGAAAYIDDTQQIQLTEQDTDAQTNTDTYGNQESTTSARSDEEGRAAYSDIESTTARTDTETRAARTDTESTAAKQNKEEIKAYTDTERRTKYILISPDKYYEIEKELVTLGAYDIMKQAVSDTMLLNVWEGGDCYDDHIV